MCFEVFTLHKVCIYVLSILNTSSSVYEAYKAGADDLDKDVRPPPHLYLSHLVWLMGLTQTRTLYV
jgi:hypothetical protein